MRGATHQRANFQKQLKTLFNMYKLSIYNRPSNEIRSFEFTNIREALTSFIERCDELGYEYEEDNDGNFIAGGLGHDNEITLTSNF